MKEKDGIRQLFIPQRRSLEAGFVRRAGMEISAHLGKLRQLGEAGMFSAFLPSDGEPDISGFLEEQIKKGKELCFPRYNSASGRYEMAPVADFGNDFRIGKFGIREPQDRIPAVTPGKLKDVPWLVPGVAFDRRGGRLGHGKGIYDRLLRDSAGIKIGICYEWQIIDEVPTGKDDVRMDLIVTETGTIVCT